jgi:hypothetical protein
MNAMAQQDEARRQDSTRRQNRLPPELSEFLGLLDALEDHFSRETPVN